MMNRVYPENSYIMAPLTGYTDMPFRNSIRRYGAHYMFTQMVDIGALVWGMRSNRRVAEKNMKMLERGPHEKWLGVQLLGSKPDIFREAVEMVNDYDFNLMDLNMGCPMKKVIKRGCGAAMAEDPQLACECLSIMVKHSRFPVTVKTRIVDQEDPEPTIRWCKMLEETGVQAITIHGRIRERIYSGDVAFHVLDALRESLNIQLIANGGIMSGKDALELREKTGCDCGMVARGAMGNPWLFQELQKPFLDKLSTHAPEGMPTFTPSHEALLTEMNSEINDMVEYHGEVMGMRLARKIILVYLKGRGYKASRRDEAGRLSTIAHFNEFIGGLTEELPSARFLAHTKYYEDFL